MPPNQNKALLLLFFALLGLFVTNLSMGSVDIPIRSIFRILVFQQTDNPIWEDIIWNFRMTKALTCVLAGSSLALGGLQMQTLFRNPLAGPDVLGLTSGASLAVSIVFMGTASGLFLGFLETPWTVALAATLGCLGVFLIMLVVARRIQDNVSLLIVGLMISAGTASVVSVLQYLSNAEEMQVFIFWTFGSLGNLSWYEISLLAAILPVGFIIAITNVKALNSWFLGERYVQTIGIPVRNARMRMILSACILTGAVTAFCGPIAFVGLAVPHLVKLLINTGNHKILIPTVTLGGAILMLACDIIAQLPSDYILPINAVTALIGAPVVIWVVLRIKRLTISN